MKQRITWTFEETFLGDRHASSQTANVPLTKEACEAMIARKTCGEEAQMTCAGKTCWYTPVITDKYSWWQKQIVIVYSCQKETCSIAQMITYYSSMI